MVQCCANPRPEINNSCHGNDVMQMLCQNAVKKCCQCISKPSYRSVLQMVWGRATDYRDWLRVEQAAVRHPQKTSSGALWFLHVHGQHSQHKSSAAAPSQPVTDWQVPVMIPKQSSPGTVAIQSLLITVGTSHSASPDKLEKSHPHFNIQNIFRFFGGGFADISEMCTALWSWTREQTRTH